MITSDQIKNVKNPDQQVKQQNKSSGFRANFNEALKYTYGTDQNSRSKKERRIVRRNQISFILSLFTLMYGFETWDMSINDLRTSKYNDYKHFMYCSVFSCFLVCFSATKFIHKMYLIFIPFVLKFLYYLIIITQEFYELKFNTKGGEQLNLKDQILEKTDF